MTCRAARFPRPSTASRIIHSAAPITGRITAAAACSTKWSRTLREATGVRRPFRFRQSLEVETMSKTLKGAIGALGMAAGTLMVGVPAYAQAVQAGSLSCHEAGGWGFVFGSSHDIHCTFSPV